MSGRDRRGPPAPAAPSHDAGFEGWLADGMAPDGRDHAAGRMLADAWRDRRRATADLPASGTAVTLARWRVWWWAPLSLVAVAAVVVLAWPVPGVVDGDVLARAYADAMGLLPLGSP